MSKIIIDEKKIDEVLTKGVEEVLIKDSLKKKLMSGKKLRIKFGIDPTGSVLHLGHAVILRKLREFQNLGHQVIFLIGDFTARIGDPTGRSITRKALANKEIVVNMKSYVKQAGLLLDMSKVEVKYNSKWLSKLSLDDLVALMSKVTYAQVAQRADFKERIKNDIDLSLQEFMYPVLQSYDSVILKADVEIGGTDQKFNLLMGRQLQKRYNQELQDIITCPLLEGLSGGDKMSKSLNNYIALMEKSEEMYGKIMSLTDNLIIKYFTLCTDISLNKIAEIKQEIDIDKINPRDLKMRLAFEITKIYHNENEAKKAEKHFIKVIQQKEIPDEITNYELRPSADGTNWKIIDLLVKVKMAGSKNEAKRLIKQNGIKVDNTVIKDINKIIEITENGVLLQKGKRQFVKIIKKL
ncbi:tyrosine--tRNA ligase [Candidatus Kuenenbacteria bacterium HGW-Kuenenbacteria-1]|uniref:Tyrosine--tRNA ligase n=1 Tax=Candidatus Kuenenbacteria bacterium HGW-Kuenenbacteria-1 TaxID=2013812 RepID=A0A2N1UP04_9BACT|nr:MAG: tyrosine--tRNA ligase [Candidatus Kuenenbacteria bacterium HGW-Kuenenbacteria-1]